MSLVSEAPDNLPAAESDARGRSDALAARVRAELRHIDVEGLLGAGATAYVFAAHHALLDLELAVKVLREPAHLDPAGAQRLRREAHWFARTGGEFGPRALDAGELADGTPYFVMTRCRGRALSAHADAADLSVAEVVEVGEGLLDALCAMHAHGLLHRDVKPDNAVLDGRRNGRTRVRLIDLGLAKRMHADAEHDELDPVEAARPLGALTAPGTFVGTPSYIAPEQLMARPLDARADVYAAGATLYHLLTGVPPFQHEDVPSTLAACLRDPLTPVGALRRGVPREVAAVVERALARDPEDRFADAYAMRRALSRAAGATDPLAWGNTATIVSTRVPILALNALLQL